MKKQGSFLCSTVLLLSLCGCFSNLSSDIAVIGGADGPTAILTTTIPDSSNELVLEASTNISESAPLEETPEYTESTYETSEYPIEGEYYYDLDNVVLYLETYGTLPENYITKNEARDLGWEGGSVERYLEGAAIGGDHFGNREELLPMKKGRSYTECDLNTNGKSSRGAERLVFSSDGLYFHTEDHYESFTEVWVEDGEVVSG